MSETSIKLTIPFEALARSITQLESAQKRQLWELLEAEMAQVEEEEWEQDPQSQAELLKARAAYQSGDYISLDDYLAKGTAS